MGYVKNEATGGLRPDHENPCLLSWGAWNMLDSQRGILKGLEAEKFKIDLCWITFLSTLTR